MVSLLIIEDNQEILESLAGALAQPGVEVLKASDSEKGIELFLRRRPQVVLADLVMPKLSGLDLLDRIMDVDPGTEVLLMTAHHSAETAVRAIKGGARDYLHKPVSPGVLLEKIGAAVQEARRRQSPPPSTGNR